MSQKNTYGSKALSGEHCPTRKVYINGSNAKEKKKLEKKNMLKNMNRM